MKEASQSARDPKTEFFRYFKPNEAHLTYVLKQRITKIGGEGIKLSMSECEKWSPMSIRLLSINFWVGLCFGTIF